ncbi:MAG: hypothetical protein Q4D25_11685 [Bacteroidales bacterium]|jgi:hypothetical protein|nr:hypothetical protein [Bacteroidales bacterium]
MKTINGMLVVVITALLGVLCGCSQEDDGYDSDMYTLAEEMGTRGGGGDPGGTPRKKRIKWDKEGQISFPSKGSKGSSAPILFGEYDTDTLTVSVSNFVGHAAISIHSVGSGSLMSSTTITVPSGSPIDFPLSLYPTGVDYKINVVLSDSSAYVGLFDL